MSSTPLTARVYNWATTQRNLTIFVSILVALPTAYTFQSIWGDSTGNFLLLVTLAVGVPTAYDEYWPHYRQTRQAIAWVLVACLVAIIEFTGLYLVATEYGSLSAPYASAGAFLVTNLGNFVLLSRRGRP